MKVKTTKPYNKKLCFEHYQPLFASHNAHWKVFVAMDILVKTTKPYNKKPCFEHYQPLFASHNAHWKVFVAMDMKVKTTEPYNNKPCFEHYQPLFASHNAQWKVFVSSQAEGRGVYYNMGLAQGGAEHKPNSHKAHSQWFYTA